MKTPRILFLALCASVIHPLGAQVLKQSTAVTVQIGPAVAASDGNTEVADLTITEIEISKAGGTFAAPNGSATLTLDDDGFYKLALTTSDTDTLGLLVVKVVDGTAMTFGDRFQVIAANAFDGIYGSGDYLQVDAMQVEGGDATDQIDARIAAYDAPTNAEMVARTLAAASYATASNQTAIEADTQDIQSRLPAALVAGRMSSDAVAISGSTATADAVETNIANLDASVASRLASAGYTAPLDAAGTRTAVGLATANLDTQLSNLSSAIGSPLQAGSYTAPLDATGTRTAIGLATANLDTQLAALPTAAENADATWDEVLSGHLTAGTTGNALNAAGSAGDPWSTSIPGAYGAGTAGYIVGNVLVEPIAANVTQWGGSAIATPNVAGVPIADLGYVDGSAASDNTTALVDAIWDEPLSGHTAAGTAGDTLSDILADTNELQGDDYPTALANLNTAIATIDAIVDSILIDTSTTLSAALTTIDTNVDSIYTEVLKIPRTGQSHTYTNDTSGASESVTISQP